MQGIFRPLSVSVAHAASPQDDLFHHFFPAKDHFYLHTPAHFGIYYDSRSRTPKWVLEHFDRNTSSSANSNKLKRPPFFSDVKIDDAFRLSPRDYTNSGFDRGHLAAAASYNHNETAHRATFTMANIVPQAPGLNKGFWKHLEAFTQRLLKEHQEVIVISGPAYLPTRTPEDKWVYSIPTIGSFPKLCQVPSHFYKVIVTRNHGEDSQSSSLLQVAAFLVPNSNDVSSSAPPLDFVIRISDLEALIGLRFFDSFLASNFTQHLDSCVIEKDSKYLEKTLTVPRPDVLEPRQVTVKNDNAYVVVENVTYAFRHLCADGKCNSLFQ